MIIGMPLRLPLRLIISAALAVIVVLVFPLINYKPSAGAEEYSTYLLILLGIAAIIWRVFRVRASVSSSKHPCRTSSTEVDDFVRAATGSVPAASISSKPGATGSTKAITAPSPSQKHQTLIGIVTVLFCGFLGLLWIGLSVSNMWPVTLFRPQPVVTMTEFDQLQKGMSYEQVAKIIGAPGKLTMTSTRMPFRAYTWENTDVSSVTCQFMNDQLTERNQSRLPEE